MQSNKKNNIVKLIPYYGSWPVYINLFNKTCRYNPGIDFIFITDLDPYENVAENVFFYKMSFAGLKKKIESTFTFQVPDFIPYKLCDFRPAFGLIFHDILQEYELWGYSDIDLIYGNISKVLNRDMLNDYEIISFKKGHLQGPLTLYKNYDFINNLFKRGDFYKTVFTTPEYISFDEFGLNTFYVNIKSKEEILALPDDNISVIAFKSEAKGEIRVHAKQFGKEDLSLSEILVFDKGRIYNYHSGQDYIFYHWVLEKRALWFKYPDWIEDSPEKFYISATGFYTENEFKFYWIIHSWRFFKGYSMWWKLKITNYIKRRFGFEVVLDTYPRKGWVKKLK